MKHLKKWWHQLDKTMQAGRFDRIANQFLA